MIGVVSLAPVARQLRPLFVAISKEERPISLAVLLDCLESEVDFNKYLAFEGEFTGLISATAFDLAVRFNVKRLDLHLLLFTFNHEVTFPERGLAGRSRFLTRNLFISLRSLLISHT